MKISALNLTIFIFCIFLFSFGTQNLSLEFKGDENLYFESAKEMLESGDIITPRYMGKARFQKPVLFYWLIIIFYKIFGVSWFAARLPSVVFAALCVFLTYAMSNLFFENKKIGLFAALFLATTPLYYRYARLAVPDMALLFFITLALYYFVRFYNNREERISSVSFFAAMALAFLAKGPVGLVIPLIIVFIFCLIKKEKKLFVSGNIFTGIAVFILIIAPWFYFMYRIHGDTFLNHLWGREVLERLGRGHADIFFVRYFKGLIFYASALITKFLPYSLFMPLAFINSVRMLPPRSSDKGTEKEKSAHLFLILWVLVVFFFFTFVAERRTHYLLILSPPAFILIGIIFKRAILEERFFSKIGFRMPYLATFIGIISFAILFVISDFISGNGRISLWKYALLVIPIILLLGFRFRKSTFMPLSMAFSLVVIYIAMIISPPLGLFTNKMERAASVIKSEYKVGDRIGIGSHGIIPEELQVYFDVPVDNVKITYKKDGTQDLKSAPRLLGFLDSEKRVFCVIKRKDYDVVIPLETKKDLCVLDRYYVWKRRIKFDKELKESVGSTEFRFREIFQNEIYVVSNRYPKKVINDYTDF